MTEQKISEIAGILFDLDGVIVSTDEYHFKAWKMMADKEGIYFDREINEQLRGVSRMESLEIILKKAKRVYSNEEKAALANSKNECYKRLITELTPENILPGVMKFVDGVKAAGIKTAIGSSSRNTDMILKRIGLQDYFDAIVSGNDITKSKPDPEVFLLAAKRINANPENCLVVEDSYAGIDAAVSGKMKSLGVGYASGYEKADIHAQSLASISIQDIIGALCTEK